MHKIIMDDLTLFLSRSSRGQAAPAAAACDVVWVEEDVQRHIQAYGGTQGPRTHIPVTAMPKDYLDMFIDDQVWDLLVNMTNCNATHKRLTGRDKGLWQPVDLPGMKAFVGLTITTGIVRMPTLPMYWETSCPLSNLAGFSDVMSRDRFLQIMRYLHGNDEAVGNPGNDKLYKVREFITRINENFSSKYTMGCHISIEI